MTPSTSEPLFPGPLPPSTDSRTFLNPSLWFVDRTGYRVVFCRHDPIYRFALDDLPHLRYVAVMLRQSELATQEELARAFGHSVASQRRWERRYQEYGTRGGEGHFSSGRPRKLDSTQEQFVRCWFLQGISNAEIARRLGVGEATVHRTCKRLGLQRSVPPAPELPFDATSTPAPLPEPSSSPSAEPALAVATPSLPLSPMQSTAPGNTTDDTLLPTASPRTASERSPAHQTLSHPLSPTGLTPCLPVPAETPSPAGPPSPEQTLCLPVATLPATIPTCPKPSEEFLPMFTVDRDPTNRQGDRLLARQGLLSDAVPLFASAEHLPRLGVLLAVPVLVRDGVLSVFQEVYGSLHPSFYGLRTLVLTLHLMALLRIKCPENLKEYSPDDLGRVLGLDRAPEVKTVRRKLSELAARAKGKQLLEALARQRLARQEEALG